MSDSFKILLTSFFTITGGIIVYIITRSFIDYIMQQRNLIGEIFYTAIIAKEIIHIPDGPFKESKKNEIAFNFNKIATNLIVNMNILPCYSYLEFLNIVYEKKAILQSAKNLNSLANLFKQREVDWMNYFSYLQKLSIYLKINYDLIKYY